MFARWLLPRYLHSYIKTLVGNSFSHFKKGWEEYRQKVTDKEGKAGLDDIKHKCVWLDCARINIGNIISHA